jgi:hypothetical protein
LTEKFRDGKFDRLILKIPERQKRRRIKENL